ncbi:pyocin knob domain-containing protein [Phocaeicola vulgatus]|nr:pyocin knob domain-containing protein [Phocaeicola vulgatus]MDB0742899.1 pyocin knob domain-containing protein [Phocaeicola vulgatus]
MIQILLEGLLGINDTWYKRRFGEITDFNEANNTGYMFVDKTQSLDNKPNTSSNYGFLETIAINDVTTKQTFVDFQSGFFIRICNNGTWTDWKQIQTTKS